MPVIVILTEHLCQLVVYKIKIIEPFRLLALLKTEYCYQVISNESSHLQLVGHLYGFTVINEDMYLRLWQIAQFISIIVHLYELINPP